MGIRSRKIIAIWFCVLALFGQRAFTKNLRPDPNVLSYLCGLRLKALVGSGKSIPGKKIVPTLIYSALGTGGTLGLFFSMYQFSDIDGNSMEPALSDGDRVYGMRRFYDLDRGDIVTFEVVDPDTGATRTLIKRIIGLPNEEVQTSGDKVYINGNLLDDWPVITSMWDNFTSKSLILKDDEYFVMGDNRPHSLDSRRLGPIKRNQMILKIFQ